MWKYCCLFSISLIVPKGVVSWLIKWVRTMGSKIKIPVQAKTLGDFFSFVQALVDNITQYLSWWEVAGTHKINRGVCKMVQIS